MLGYLLCMVHLNELFGILQLNVEIMDLLLQEFNHGISLAHVSVMLLDLALKLANTSISILKILGKLLNLLIPCVCHHVVGLSKVSGLLKPLIQKSLEMVQCIHAPHRSQDGLLSAKFHQVVHVLHPLKPHGIIVLYNREQANGSQGDLHGVLLTKGGERPHGGNLPSVSKV
jgi:hypothetical protein